MKLFIRILLITLWCVLAAGAVALMGFSNISHKTRHYTGLNVNIDYPGPEKLISTGDIHALFARNFGKLETIGLDRLSLEAVTATVARNPYLRNVNVHATVEGVLVIRAEQCRPVLRMIDNSGMTAYLDETGRLMPVRPDYPVRLPVATGELGMNMVFGKTLAELSVKNATTGIKNGLRALHIAGCLQQDSILMALVEQIALEGKGEIRLYTKTGLPDILFGDTVSAGEKLGNLKAFVKYGLSHDGPGKYSQINLEYKNQVVCIK